MIPRKIHFIYGLQDDFAGKEFGFAHWAAIRSAAKLNPEYKIYYWYAYLPDNYYFEDIKNIVELKKIDPPQEIFGNTLHHVAHKADVVRLNILREHGGIYLDMDTVCVKKFDDLLQNNCVMGRETLDGREQGLCNAVILSEANGKFIDEWYQSYRSFRSKGRDQYWAEHSVILPMQLSKKIPECITILPPDAFFLPDWGSNGLRAMFYERHEFSRAYAHHLWETVSWGALSSTNERNVNVLSNSYTNILHKVLGSEIESLKKQRMLWVEAKMKLANAKLNLGSGPKCYIDYINCDQYLGTGADLIFDISQKDWPINNDCVEEVLMHSILEHFNTYEIFFKELYRVCKSGAIVKIIVPYPRHDWFVIDPTHVKGWHPESFTFLDKEISLQRYFSGNSMTPLALYWNVDFRIKKLDLKLSGDEVQQEINMLFKSAVDINLANKYLNNVAAEIHVELVAIK